MGPGKIYKTPLLLTAGDCFNVRHRLCVETSGSKFTEFDCDLNGGIHSHDEVPGMVAHKALHHSAYTHFRSRWPS
jgi:hypothetical protein